MSHGDTNQLTDVAIDAHYYDGGLKVARLAGGKVPPPWVPADATDLVGLHEAFSLQSGDRAVEISRLRSGEHALTWIAVYRRSQDASFGDRGNYAGVGVWLLNQVVHGPEYLLDGLDTLSRTLVDSGVDATRQVAAQFLAPKNLPRELAPLVAMPPGLSGWTFSQDLLPAKELYQVTVADGEHVAWEPVAEHILRMALLPAPTAAHARSLILVRPTANAGIGAATGLKPLQAGLAAELAKALPASLAEHQRNLTAMARDHQELTAQHGRVQQELAKARAAHENQALRIKDLERQLEASDPDGRFKAMGGTLARVDEQARANGLALEQVAQTVRQIELKTNQTARMGSVHEGGKPTSVPSSDPAGPAGGSASSKTNQTPSQLKWSRDSYRWIVGGAAALIIVAIGYLVWIMWPDPTPSADNLTPLVIPREDQRSYEAGYDNRSIGDNFDTERNRADDRGQDYDINRSGNYSSTN